MNEHLRSNQFPFESHHYNGLSQIFGSEFAWNVAVMAVTYRHNGGCNPNAVAQVFPEGAQGLLDEDKLQVVLENFQAWHEFE